MTFSRRVFLKLSVTSAGSFLIARFGAGRAFALPLGSTLDPVLLPKFVTPLLVPPVMPKAGTLTMPGGMPADYYEISMRQITQQILPAGHPATTVWGYGAVKSASKKGLLIHNAPSLTIEARWKRPVRVKWINELRVDPADPGSPFLPHLLPVDPTLHWANPPGGVPGRDMRPSFDSTPGPYLGPVPIVTHVHGAVGVGDESDGYAEAWYLAVAGGIDPHFAAAGTWYDFFKNKAAVKGFVAPGASSWQPGTAVFQYPNDQRASTIWYHDHALGMTRLNVYSGPAGFFIVRGGPSGDKAVLDTRTGLAAVLPGPAPMEGDKFPPNKTYYEIPIAVQDRSFNANGSLFYPDSRAFFDEIAGPYIPYTDVSPIWNPEFFGDMIMVNGNTWPFHAVEQRRYRLRFLNGCNSRFLILDFSSIAGVGVWQIGNEGGFLAVPVDLTTDHGNRLLMSPAERADLIVDFTNVPVGSHVLGNVGPDEPFGGGVPGVDFPVADPATTGQVMRFDVVPALAPDPTTPATFLQLPAIAPLPAASVTRPLALLEAESEFFEEEEPPTEALLGTVSGDPNTAAGEWMPLHWDHPVTENPAAGATEIWEFYNATADAHPIHIHETTFEVMNRQAILVDDEAMTVEVDATATPTPPEPWETGFKDTVIAYPGQVTRVRGTFASPGQFVWHCHIVEHEDNEMMRPYRIGPPQAGEPS